MIIGIAGDSGVGKSTISELISLFFGINEVTILSTDDLHKWDRYSSRWDSITHLNPDANNLGLGNEHLKDILEKKEFYRSAYNHKTGYFDPPKLISPTKITIIEGLHAFYTDFAKKTIDLKIFVDTNESLRKHWKVVRDTSERGYSKEKSIRSIELRKKDAEKNRESQIDAADVVIKLFSEKEIQNIGQDSEIFNLKCTAFNVPTEYRFLIDFVKETVETLGEYITTSKQVGNDRCLCQGYGGNISVKLSNDMMMIKSSGTKVKNHKYSIVDSTGKNILGPRASIETKMHLIFKEKCVMHFHPICVTTLLCLKDSKRIISELFQEYEYVEYVNPGNELAQSISGTRSLCFLENHGLIVAGTALQECTDKMMFVENKSKEFLKQSSSYREFDFDCVYFDNIAMFPDAVIFDSCSETLSANEYIKKVGSTISELRPLSSDSVEQIKNMESEKYRLKKAYS